MELRGFHLGKLYSYLWILSELGMCEIIEKEKIIGINSFLKAHYRGFVNIYPKLKLTYFFLMEESIFNEVVEYAAPENSRELIASMKNLCRRI